MKLKHTYILFIFALFSSSLTQAATVVFDPFANFYPMYSYNSGEVIVPPGNFGDATITGDKSNFIIKGQTAAVTGDSRLAIVSFMHFNEPLDGVIRISFDFEYTYDFNHYITYIDGGGYDHPKTDNYALFSFTDITGGGTSILGVGGELGNEENPFPEGFTYTKFGTIEAIMSLSPLPDIGPAFSFYIESSSTNYDGPHTSAFELKISNFQITDLSPVTAVPEPEVYAMMFVGLGLIGFAARHKSSKKSYGIGLV